MSEDAGFWAHLEQLLATSRLVIDRPAGSEHPRYPDMVYPLDYGYLEGTTSMDGNGIDVWRGSRPERGIVGIVCTVDLWKRDSEVKLLLGCTEDEVAAVLTFHNDGMMRALHIPRPQMTR